MTRTPDAPVLDEGDVLLYDEPGRCGGLDSHHLHCRLVKHFGLWVYVHHGSGDERIKISSSRDQMLLDAFSALDSNGRYWMLAALFSVHRDSADKAKAKESMEWRTAAAEKRIKTRKQPSRGVVKVWIEPAVTQAV